jgi:hypothetical protein
MQNLGRFELLRPSNFDFSTDQWPWHDIGKQWDLDHLYGHSPEFDCTGRYDPDVRYYFSFNLRKSDDHPCGYYSEPESPELAAADGRKNASVFRVSAEPWHR